MTRRRTFKLRQKVKVQCPGCKLMTEISSDFPSLLSPVIATFKCSGCESSLLTRLTVPQRSAKDWKPDQIHVATKIMAVSTTLAAILIEEAQERAALEAEKNGKVVGGHGDVDASATDNPAAAGPGPQPPAAHPDLLSPKASPPSTLARPGQ